MGAEDERRSLWRRIAGDGSHLGFWTLPVFVATALGGAVIAGALAQVYYAQQVADLEVARPLEDPAAAGVVALTVELTPAPPSPAPAPAAPGGQEQPDGAPLPAPADDTTEQPAEQPTGPPPPAAGARTRSAVGFAVAVDGGTTFVATTYGAVADPGTADGVAAAVTVASGGGSARGVVHAWDEARGVAVVRVDLADVPILPWRPTAVPVAQGDVVVLAAVTPGMVGVQLPGRLGAVTEDALVSDLPVDPVFDGAPLVDATGRVVGIQSSTAAPFGAVRARQLCVELISGCDLLEQVDEDDATESESSA